MRALLRSRIVAVVALGLFLGLGLPPAAAEEAEEGTGPTLRLLAARQQVTLTRFGTRVFLNLGVWAAVTDADLQFRVVRPDYESPPTLAQTDPETGEVLQELPPELLDGWRGLRRFVRVTFRNQAGERIATRRFTFCPNAWDRQRVDDSGPTEATYPDSCGSTFFPFLRGMVWGIDRGWATGLLSGSEFDDFGTPSIRVPAGRYRVAVRITRPWVEQLGLSPEDTRVVLDVTVRNARGRFVEVEARSPQSRVAPDEGIPTVTDPDPATLPDLAALPLWEMSVGRRRKVDLLRFAASPWNAGPAPLVVEGFRRPGEDVMDAYQYFYDSRGEVVGRALVGTMEYHAGGGHDHWHFLQLVEFSILDESKTQVVLSGKQSFCVAPTDAVDLSVEGAHYRPWSLRLSSRCGSSGSIWVREVLAPGWADTYFQWVAGQAFDITNLPNGSYYVRLRVNPLGELHDRSPDNDVEDRLIHLGGTPGSRTLVVEPWHGMDV